MTMLPRTLLVLLILLTVPHRARAAGATLSFLSPVLVGPVPVGANLVILPDGRWDAYQPAAHNDGFKITRVRSTNQGRSWSTPEVVHNLPGDNWGGTVALLDRRGEVHLFVMRPRIEGPGQRIAIDLCIDIWHLRSLDGRKRWSEPQRVFKGYTGSIQAALQLKSGRIEMPFGSWVAGRPADPPTGSHFSTAVYSDDDGKTWQQSPAQLTSPCHGGFNGDNYGACEPVLVQRNDGRTWMLMRTQDGFLYESFSQDGTDWSEARPARFFPSSDSPAAVVKLPDGRLVVCWNNCEMPPRVDGQGVYGGRDALHLAISADDAKTWRGYREIYLDKKRNDTPPKTGDRGTAYPFLIVTNDGRLGVISGQGSGRRALTLVDPRWLVETRREDDFRAGLQAWSTFTEFGPATGWWRDRTPGAHLVDHPDRPGAKVLHVRRPEGMAGDGAVWNFPLGRKGRLTLRLRLQPGFGGGSIALTDRFFNPTDDNGERKALLRLPIDADGRLAGGSKLEPGRWHTLDVNWNLDDGKSRVLVVNREAVALPRLGQTVTGACYLRLRSTAAASDAAGFLVESVAVDVNP